nr:fumarylacetoacetate hydrolase family protein [Novosphingobium sp. BW1]
MSGNNQGSTSLHHEVELVIGGALRFDMARRDLQAEAKPKGRPWDMAKGFEASAPLGPIVPEMPPRKAAIRYELDGEVRQQGTSRR